MDPFYALIILSFPLILAIVFIVVGSVYWSKKTSSGFLSALMLCVPLFPSSEDPTNTYLISPNNTVHSGVVEFQLPVLDVKAELYLVHNMYKWNANVTILRNNVVVANYIEEGNTTTFVNMDDLDIEFNSLGNDEYFVRCPFPTTETELKRISDKCKNSVYPLQIIGSFDKIKLNNEIRIDDDDLIKIIFDNCSFTQANYIESPQIYLDVTRRRKTRKHLNVGIPVTVIGILFALFCLIFICYCGIDNEYSFDLI